jgi:enduracididine biosynthesis enzyme MppR
VTSTGERAPARGPYGYTLPLSPTGSAAMVAPPPWHFSGEFIWVDYQIDPGRVAGFLPPELVLSETGAAAAAFSWWQWCTDGGQELQDPARSQFSEFMILLAVSYRGESAARCPYAWVDQAVPMARGWIQGMPKQFGVIRMTRTVSAGRAGPRLARGGTYCGALSVHDRRTVEARVTLTGLVAEPPMLSTAPLVHTRVFPAWIPGSRNLREMTVSDVSDVEYSAVWQGDAALRFTPDALAVDPELVALQPVRTGRGFVFGYAETLLGGADPETGGPVEERDHDEQYRFPYPKRTRHRPPW